MTATPKSGGYKWERAVEQIEQNIEAAGDALAELQERDITYTRRLELTGQIGTALVAVFTGTTQLNRIAVGWSNEQQRQIRNLEERAGALQRQLDALLRK
jgi:hypothetical protein